MKNLLSYEIYYKGAIKSFPLDRLQNNLIPDRLVLKAIDFITGEVLQEALIFNY